MAVDALSQRVHITNASDIGGGASVGTIGAAIPASATLIGGETPGGLLAAVQINAAGELVVAGGGDAEGTIGNAAPTIAVQMGARDGAGDLQNLLVDGTGALSVTGGGDAEGTPGAAVPSKTVAVGGKNGANLQTLTAGAGVLDAGTLKVTIATDDAVMDEIKDTQIERYLEIQRCATHTDWTAVGSAGSIASTTNHVPHEDKTTSVSFAKTAGTTIGGIQDTITAKDASSFEGQTIIAIQLWLSSYADIDYLWLRIGTDASNYAEYRIEDVTDFQASRFERIQFEQHQLFANTGTGADFSAITYIAAGVATNLAGDTLAGIIIDYINLLSLPNVASSQSLNVDTGNIANQVRVTKFGSNTNATASVGSGASGTGVQRVEIANDGTGQVYPKSAYTSTQTLTAASADNGAPSGTDGTALQADTVSAHISVTCNADVTNADINIWYREQGTDIWTLLPGGALVDLQAETDDRWGVTIPGCGLYATRLYVEIDNYADGGSGEIDAYIKETSV